MNKKGLESFSESTIYLVLVKALSFLPLILLPLLARSETSVIFTQVMLALTIDRFAFIVYEFGSHLPNINRISFLIQSKGIKDSTNEISLIFSQVNLLRFFIWLVLLAITYFFLFLFEFSSINRSFLLICLISGLFRVLSPIWLFQAVRQLKYQFYMALLSKLICFSAIAYLFFLDNLSGFNFLMIFALSDFLGLAVGMIYYFSNNFKILKSTFFSFKQIFIESLHYCLGRISSAGYNYIPPILLGILNPMNFVFFSLSERIYTALQSINSPIMDSIFAHRISDNVTKFRRAIILVLMFSSMISLFIFIFSDLLIVFLFGKEYFQAALILRVLCVSFVIQSLSSLLGHPFLTNKGFGYITNNSVSFGFLFCFILMIFLILNQSFNSLSLAIMLMLTEFIVLIFRLIFIFFKRYKLFNDISDK